MAKKKKKEKSMFDLYKSIRGSWNGVNPVTKVVESKKHKNKIFENE